MKAKTFTLLFILSSSVLIILGSCATMKSPDKLTYERFCGIWVNEDYEPKPGELKPFAKFTMNPDGTYISYQFVMQSGPTGVGTYTVKKRWTDSDGNSYYLVKTWSHLSGVTNYELWRIDKYNSIFEFNYSNNEYPEAIDPKAKHSTYRIYYRF
jgi:hypothetical protein